MATHPQ